MTPLRYMKMFLLLGEMQKGNGTREDRQAYRERIVFATPGMIKPQDWDDLALDVREERLRKALENLSN